MSNPTNPLVPIDLHPYLNEIATRLFSGHAAVMIGSGLSKNAKPQSPSCLDFPDWSELGDLFYEKLHNRKPDVKNRYLSVPKLAHEVEAAIGRPALDRLLRDAIPNEDYEPSPLHKELLELPWADVFTTNYDTLLERACRAVTSQRYDIVVNLDDLVYSESPRIVKLHGSFPSDRPFIVTDEDYRRYPADFAPFVNTVRQALLENTLCLIGFSGDDPNFLQWIGWIHDNLGRRNSPKTYLIGMLMLSDSQRKLLERRNIVSVDMSHYEGVDAHDHEKAIGRFIEFLKRARAEFNTRNWPHSHYSGHPGTKEELPSQIGKLLMSWRSERRIYPGWVVLPEVRRRALWAATRDWIHSCPEPGTLPRFVDLEFAFELIWRMERCLSPIFDNQIDFLQETVNRYLPTDSEESLEFGTRIPEGPSTDNLTRTEVRDMCNHLLLAILRFYREEGHIQQWGLTNTRLGDIVGTMSADHKARLHYERTLFALFELNPHDLKRRLHEWPIDDSLPFWESRRAGLLAEIGQVSEAARILEDALVAIRTKANLKPVTKDYSLVSQESFVMLLLRFVGLSSALQTGEFGKRQEDGEQFSERHHTLRQYDCDPWNELEMLERALARPPVYTSHLTEESTFDIGRVTRTRHFGGDNLEVPTAYEFLRFCEDAGIPFKIIPGCIVATKGATGTLERIATQSPYWAMATLVRIGSDEVVDRIFNRESLAGMSTASVDLLVERYLESLDLATADIGATTRHWEENHGTLLAKVVPEILSRLCCRCSLRTQRHLLEFLIERYRSDRKEIYKGIRHLAKRLLDAVPLGQRMDFIAGLLELPIPSGLNPLEQIEYLNPFRFVGDWADSLFETPAIADEQLNPFIEAASSDNQMQRQWGMITLGTLHSFRLLSSRTIEQFANVLWARLDDAGLPWGTFYFRRAILQLPHPPDIAASDLFRAWVRSQRFPVGGHGPASRKPERNTLCDEIIGAGTAVAWSQHEVHWMVHQLAAWWDADKKHIKDEHENGSDEFVGVLSGVVGTLVAVINPRVNVVYDKDMKAVLERLAHEMSEQGLPAIRFEVACLHVFPERRASIFQRIEDALASSIAGVVVDALGAVSVASARIGVEAPAREREDLIRVVEAVGEMLRWRRQIGLRPAMDVVRVVTKRHPWSFGGTLEKAVLDGLRHMIGDTAIRRSSAPPLERDKEGPDISTKLILRRAAARLAFTLFQYYSRRGDSVPGAITEWESVCRSDHEFAEIRNQWLELSAP